MKRIEFELLEFHSFNGVDKVIEFMIESYDTPYEGEVDFQGDFVKMGMFPINKTIVDSILHWYCKDDSYFFHIEDLEETKEIKVTISKGVIDLNGKAYSVILPNYVKQQLIAVLKGE